MVIGIAGIAACVWCGWASGFHRTTVGAEVTWLVTLLAVVLLDVATWRGRSSDGRLGWRLEPVGSPWPRPDRGGSRPALCGVAPWLALIVVVLVWEILGIDSGPHQYHLTISALAQAYRPLNAALLLTWILVGIGYEVARARAAIDPRAPGHEQNQSPTQPRGAFVMAVGSAGVHHGPPALLLPQSPPIGVAFWIAVPIAAVLIDWSARRSHGRRASADEFVRFISTSRLANYALIAAWAFAGYHLFAR
jgi:hypothetical protein